MKLKCFVIDDEPHALEVITGYIKMTPDLELIGEDRNPVSALAKFGDKEIEPDITFVDINMPSLSGIDFAGMLSGRTLIIFTTAFAQFAVDAFEKNAVDYLLKPISYERFLNSVDKARQRLTSKSIVKDDERAYFYFRVENKGKLIKVFINDIVFIEARQNYVRVVLEDRQHLTYLSMNEIETQLHATKLVRCHKSFICNLDKIHMIDGNSIIFQDGQRITVGPLYKPNLMKHIESNTLKSRRS